MQRLLLLSVLLAGLSGDATLAQGEGCPPSSRRAQRNWT